MRNLVSRTLMGLAMVAASVVSLVPRTASAVPCCSAPICTRESPPPPPICASCSPSCLTDDDGAGDAAADYAHDFDDSAGVCRAIDQGC